MESHVLVEFLTDMRNAVTMKIDVSDVAEAPSVAAQLVDVVRVCDQPGGALRDFHVV